MYCLRGTSAVTELDATDSTNHILTGLPFRCGRWNRSRDNDADTEYAYAAKFVTRQVDYSPVG